MQSHVLNHIDSHVSLGARKDGRITPGRVQGSGEVKRTMKGAFDGAGSDDMEMIPKEVKAGTHIMHNAGIYGCPDPCRM